MTLLNDYAPLLLRICLVALFPFSGLDKIINWSSAIKQAGRSALASRLAGDAPERHAQLLQRRPSIVGHEPSLDALARARYRRAGRHLTQPLCWHARADRQRRQFRVGSPIQLAWAALAVQAQSKIGLPTLAGVVTCSPEDARTLTMCPAT